MSKDTQRRYAETNRLNAYSRWHRQGAHKDRPVDGCPLCEGMLETNQ